MSTSKALTVREITDDPLVNKIQEAGARVLVEQSWWAEKKNSVAAVAQLILQLANFTIGLTVGLPWWAIVLIALVIGVAEVIVHATTKGPVTKSGVEKIRVKAEQAQAAEVPTVADPGTPTFSVYH